MMTSLRAARYWITQCWWARILAEHDTEPTELSGSTLKVLLGFWLLIPFRSFESSPTFAYLDFIPEAAWGIFLLFVGLTHWYTLRAGYIQWRRTSSLIGFLVWFAMAVVFVVANAPAIGFSAFLIASIGQGWVYIRLGMVR